MREPVVQREPQGIELEPDRVVPVRPRARAGTDREPEDPAAPGFDWTRALAPSLEIASVVRSTSCDSAPPPSLETTDLRGQPS